MRIIADKHTCIGSGQCVLTAPDVFDSDDDGLVDVLDSEPDPAHEPSVREAVALCPSRALSLAVTAPDPRRAH
jgi:ferredoxin